MISRFTTSCILACMLVLVFVACGRDTNPSTPSTSPVAQSSDTVSHRMPWGTWDVAIDANSGEVEIVPARTIDFSANVVRFLQPPLAPIELLEMKVNPDESKLLEGLVAMDVTLKHPFPGKMQFRGFDVRGIIHMDGGNTGIHDNGVNYFLPDGSRMLNPDGFTRWWNQVEFTTFGTIFGYTEGHFANPNYTSTATVCPYKIHTPSLDVTQPYYQMDLSQRCTFPTIDGVVKRRYRLQFDTTQQPVYAFKYSVDASWSLPDPSYAPAYPIEAFDEMANCQEPYMVKIEEYDEIPYYVDEYVSGGNLVFYLTIGDWQAENGNVLDEISHVWLESPTLFGTPVDVRNSMEFIESNHPTQATYRIVLEDMMPDGLEGQQLLVTVESASPDSFMPQIGPAGSNFDYPDGNLAAYLVADVPITNLNPQGEYAYCYFIPDWCATMRYQCSNDADNQVLMANLMSQNVDGYYNDYTHVQIWEGKTNTSNQNAAAFLETCSNLGYTCERTNNDYFDATGSRVIIAILFSIGDMPPNPAFTQQEAEDMQEFIENGGLLFFMCEASVYLNDEGLEELFSWLGMLMEYGGGATPEMSDGYTSNITYHWLTEDVESYHYYTCGQWITDDPYVLTLVATEYDEKAVLMYPLPLE